MRLGLAALIIYVVAINSAQAEMFRISTGESKETKVITELIKEVYRRLGHDTEFAFLPAERSLREVNRGKGTPASFISAPKGEAPPITKWL